MLGRALSLATVTLLIGCFAALPVRAQNLEAGKSPSQIFEGTCTACHKAPRGLLRSVPAGSLPGFLRQHYTTSSEMASRLSAYLIANGATDRRAVSAEPKQRNDTKPEANPSGTAPQLDRNGRPLRPAAPQIATQGPDEHGPDGRKPSAKQRLGSRGKPGVEAPPGGEPSKDEASKSESAKEGASDSAAPAESKSAAIKPGAGAGEGSNTSLRADPVPAVTPAPAFPEVQLPPVQPMDPGPSASPPTASPAPTTTASSGVVEPPGSRPSVPPPVPAAALQQLLARTEPSSPPSPPISQ
jgi:hypothetical protein